MEVDCVQRSFFTAHCSSPLNKLDVPSTSNHHTSTTIRSVMCEVCASNTSKYTCPRCEVKTCCLKCTKIHRKELQCDGTRDKTKFIPLKKFNNLDLSNDYRLLEEITRNVEYFKRSRQTRRHIRQRGGLPQHLHTLRLAANERKTMLNFLPQNFGRHKANSTYFNYKSNIIYWHIDWIFFNANNLKLSDSKVPETSKVGNLLNKYLVVNECPILQEKFQYYQAANLPGIKFLLKAEQKPGSTFFELDPLLSLKDNLRNKIIIEYPIIHLVLKDHIHLYNVLDSDDDGELDVKIKKANGNHVVNKIIKSSEKEDSIGNSLKNLLFGNEDTDSEMSD